MIASYFLWLTHIMLGACFGSFFCALLFRFHTCSSDEYTHALSGASSCPKCCRQLTFWELIPVFSYFILRGRCRCQKFSLQRKLILTEIAGAAAGCSAVLCFAFPTSTLILIMCFGLLFNAITDLFFLRLNRIMIGLIAFLGLWISFTLDTVYVGLLAALSGWVVFFSFERFSAFILKRKALGNADKWLISAIGLSVDITTVFYIIHAASIVGLGHAFILHRKGKMRRNTPLPFGTYLCAISILFVPLRISYLALV